MQTCQVQPDEVCGGPRKLDPGKIRKYLCRITRVPMLWKVTGRPAGGLEDLLTTEHNQNCLMLIFLFVNSSHHHRRHHHHHHRRHRHCHRHRHRHRHFFRERECNSQSPQKTGSLIWQELPFVNLIDARKETKGNEKEFLLLT